MELGFGLAGLTFFGYYVTCSPDVALVKISKTSLCMCIKILSPFLSAM